MISIMDNRERRNQNTIPWIRRRHRIFLRLLAPFIGFRMKCLGAEIEPFPKGSGRPFLILYNHQTPYDQFFLSLSFPDPVYYVATEDIFSMGFISRVIRFIAAPIPFRKMTKDYTAVRIIMQVAGEGGTVAVAPEGNRTFSGKTEYINPSIGQLAKIMNCPIVLYRIEGGYGFWPRWGSKPRKGHVRAFPARVIEPEEAASMSTEELNRKIRDVLTVNEASADAGYVSDRKAEYIECAAYVCPFCGLSVFQSSGNEVECLTCRRKMLYHEDKSITGIGFDFPFRFFNEWYEYQNAFVNRLDLLSYKNTCLFGDTADISEVIIYKKKLLLFPKAKVSLYGDRIELNEGRAEQLSLPFKEISAAAVIGRSKLNIYHNNRIYQFKGTDRFNALKYVNLYYRYRNIASEDKNGEFLGL